MASAGHEPFQRALRDLRRNLREGAFPPGARIAAVEVADTLRLSATPVREALSRLAGEGLLEERRGQGFFVRRYSAGDLADLYRLSLAYLMIGLDPARPRLELVSEAEPTPDPVVRVERLFAGWMAASAGAVLMAGFHAVQVQLGPMRRLEPRLIGDLAEEAAALTGQSDEPHNERVHRIRQFHIRRIRLSEKLAVLLERSSPATMGGI